MPEPVLDFGITIILFLQSLGSWFEAPMRFFTMLGNEEFFPLVTPMLYWCLDGGLGLRVGLVFTTNGCLNETIKLLLCAPRPYWIDVRVRAFVTDPSFGIPSGHAQSAAVVWGKLAAELRRTWAYLAAFALIFLIGLSRLYLGVHFPTDVLAGWLIGFAYLVLFTALEPFVSAWLKKHSLPEQILAACAITTLLILMGVLAKLRLGAWVAPNSWIETEALTAPGANSIDPLQLSRLFTYAGTFFGLAIGGLMVNVQGGYDASGSLRHQLGRVLIGLAGVLLLWYGLGKVFPRGEDLLAYALRFLRYTLVGLWVTWIAPLVFAYFGLLSIDRQR